MGLNKDIAMKKGEIITVRAWLKIMGTVALERNGKPRNVLSVCEKGKFMVVTSCSIDDAETVLNDELTGQITPFRRIKLDEEVAFGVTQISIYTKKFWDSVTTKNCFLGLIENYKNQEAEK